MRNSRLHMQIQRVIISTVLFLGIVFGAYKLNENFSGKKKTPAEREIKESVRFVAAQPISFENQSSEIEIYGRIRPLMPSAWWPKFRGNYMLPKFH